MQVLKPEKIITTISNLKTGEEYKTEEEWKAKGVPEAEIRRDVKVIMPSLDLLGKTKQNNIMGLLKKITGGAKKVVKKLVPKELAGIMQVAAPAFGPAAPFIYAAGALKQSGRINPLAFASMALPYAGVVGQGKGILGSRFAYGDLGSRFGQAGVNFKTARDLLGLRDATGLAGRAEDFLFGAPGVEGGTEAVRGMTTDAVDATRGIFGAEGKFDLGQSKLIRKGGLDKKGSKLNLTNIAAMAAAGASLATASKQIEEEAIAEGASDSDIDALKAEAADFWSTLSSSDFAVTPTLAQGGRVGFALGTRPTAQESGLGGLPIEADMRYSGGFMPYGAKEKADDVPARLSKNEFVFTADAVRAAGGGSVQKGAQKMYNTMKQLEAMGRA